MTYPSYPQDPSSTISIKSEVVLDRATNGRLRGRSMWPTQKHEFSVVHDLTSAELATLRTFYTTNMATAVTFTWHGDNQAYTVLMTGINNFSPLGKDGWKVTVRLEEV